MIPWCPHMASGLISGITSGTVGSMRNAEELSTTTAPACAAIGANFFEIDPPALKNAMSISAKLCFGQLLHLDIRPPNCIFLPRRPRRRQQAQLRNREMPFFQAAQELDAHGSRGSRNRDSIILRSFACNNCLT